MSAHELEHEAKAVSCLGIDRALERSTIVPNPLSDGVSSDKIQISSVKASSPILDNNAVRAKSSIGASVNDEPKESQTFGGGDLALKNTETNPHGLECSTDLNYCHQRKKNAPPSKWNPRYLDQGSDQSRASYLRDQGGLHASTPPDDPSMNDALKDNHVTARSAKPENTMYWGYHKESNERTNLLEDNSISQWPSNLIGQYKFPLSRTSATSIAPSRSIVQTPLNHNALSSSVYKFPEAYPSTSSSYPSFSHFSTLQGDPLQHIGAQVNSSSISCPATSSITTGSTPVADSAHSSHSNFAVKGLAMPSHLIEKARTSKKRSQVMNEGEITSPMNPEGYPAPGVMAFTQDDHNHIQALIRAMNDMSASEDNDGMIRSWDKMRISRAVRVNAVCEELLVTIKRAVALEGRPLCGHKRSSNKYATFGDRFNAVCNTLKTQKTVCKHLMEDPYLHQVVDDPIYASMRVANNRRVNRGKKVAIEQGRKILGLKGNGKGRPLLKDEVLSENEEVSDDAEAEEDNATLEGHFKPRDALTMPTLRDRSCLRKPTYLFQDPDDVLDSVEDDSIYTTKRLKRQKRSKTLKSDSVDPTAIPRYQTEDKNSVKPDPDSRYVFNPHAIEHLTPSYTAKPSTAPPTSDDFSFAETVNGALTSYQQPDFSNGYASYGPVANQTLTGPMYSRLQPQPQFQLPFFHTQPVIGVDANTGIIDTSSNTDHYLSDPITDETDIPADFDQPEWLLHCQKQEQRP